MLLSNSYLVGYVVQCGQQDSAQPTVAILRTILRDVNVKSSKVTIALAPSGYVAVCEQPPSTPNAVNVTVFHPSSALVPLLEGPTPPQPASWMSDEFLDYDLTWRGCVSVQSSDRPMSSKVSIAWRDSSASLTRAMLCFLSESRIHACVCVDR